MPKEGENILFFENFKKQMKMPFIIYTDFEAIIRKILGCEHERMQTSYTEKTEKHKACGYSYLVVRSDGKVVGSNTYRGKNVVGEFLSAVLQEEEKITESLATPKPIDMKCKDWEKFKNAKDCHVCNKSLIKDEFLDSMPIWDHDTGSYCGQSHKGCYYVVLKEIKFVGPKRERKEKDKIGEWVAKNQETCLFCAEPFMKKNFRDAVKDHCHITGRFRGAAHSECNKKLQINPKMDPIPVVFHNLRG